MGNIIWKSFIILLGHLKNVIPSQISTPIVFLILFEKYVAHCKPIYYNIGTQPHEPSQRNFYEGRRKKIQFVSISCIVITSTKYFKLKEKGSRVFSDQDIKLGKCSSRYILQILVTLLRRDRKRKCWL